MHLDGIVKNKKLENWEKQQNRQEISVAGRKCSQFYFGDQVKEIFKRCGREENS